MVLLILEFIGTQELFLIMVVALVVFGPRKLPEIGRSIGKSLNEFRRASDEFKRTWQMEADLEKAEKEALIERQEPQLAANNTVTPLPLPEVRDANFNNATNDFAMPDNTTSNGTTTDAVVMNDTVSNAMTNDDDASNVTPHVAETVPREPKRYTAPASTEASDSAARS